MSMGRKQYLYHVTPKENTKMILREGLKRKNGFCVYLSERPFSWWKPGMDILRVRITGLKELHISPEEGLDEILCFEDINPLRIHEYKSTRGELRKAYNHFREVTKMVEEET
jgi:hypothetical protein